MVQINLFQTQFTNDEWDAIERGLVHLLEQIVHGRIPSGDDVAEARRLAPHAETALLKIELEQS